MIFVFAAKFPVPVPTRIETLLEPKLPTARSGRPSPLKSSLVSERGTEPVVKSVFVPKLPVPVPSSTETLSEPLLATARSGRPSLLKSSLMT